MNTTSSATSPIPRFRDCAFPSTRSPSRAEDSLQQQEQCNFSNTTSSLSPTTTQIIDPPLPDVKSIAEAVLQVIPSQSQHNFALDKDGAKVLASNPGAKRVNAILDDDGDTFMRNDCKDDKWVVIELSQVAKVSRMEIVQHELYSSRIKQFEVRGRQSHPRTDNVETSKGLNSTAWKSLGVFTAEKTKGTQSFNVDTPLWARYLLLRFVSHYGSESVCAINGIAVYGKSAAEELEDQLAGDELGMPADSAEGWDLGSTGVDGNTVLSSGSGSDEKKGGIGDGVNGDGGLVNGMEKKEGIEGDDSEEKKDGSDVENSGGSHGLDGGVEEKKEGIVGDDSSDEHHSAAPSSNTNNTTATSNSTIIVDETEKAHTTTDTTTINEEKTTPPSTDKQQQQHNTTTTTTTSTSSSNTTTTTTTDADNTNTDTTTTDNNNKHDTTAIKEESNKKASTTVPLDSTSPGSNNETCSDCQSQEESTTDHHTSSSTTTTTTTTTDNGSSATTENSTPTPTTSSSSSSQQPSTTTTTTEQQQQQQETATLFDNNNNNNNNQPSQQDITLEELPVPKSKAGSSVYDLLVQEIRAAKAQQRVMVKAMEALHRNLTTLAHAISKAKTEYELSDSALAARVDALVELQLKKMNAEVIEVSRRAAKRDHASLSFVAMVAGVGVVSMRGFLKEWPKWRSVIVFLAVMNGVVGVLLQVMGRSRMLDVNGKLLSSS